MIPTCDCGEELNLSVDGYACPSCKGMYCEVCGAELPKDEATCEACSNFGCVHHEENYE